MFFKQKTANEWRISDWSSDVRSSDLAASALAQHRQMTPQGTLRISLPPEFYELSFVKVLVEFSQQYPDVRLELDLSPRRVDLVAERFDVAIRAATQLPDDSTLVARRITTLQHSLYASPCYMNNPGTPKHPADMIQHVGLALFYNAGEQKE